MKLPVKRQNMIYNYDAAIPAYWKSLLAKKPIVFTKWSTPQKHLN